MAFDALITRDGGAQAPLDYTVPASASMIAGVVSAVLDGTGAAGAFVPELELIAPNGDVVAYCAPDLSIAAGRSVAVSWFPGAGEIDEDTTTTSVLTGLTSSGGTITVGSPAGPVPNVDLPASGVSPGTYGDAGHVGRFTVDAQGRLSAATAVGIGAGAGTGLVQIFDTTLGVAAASIDTGANAIPTGHQHLVIVLVGRSSAAASALDNLIRFNGDTGANYDDNAGRVSAGAFSGVLDAAGTSAEFGQIIGSLADANRAATIIGYLPSYDQTTFWKTGVYLDGFIQGIGSSTYQNWMGSFTWRSTVAVNQITVRPTSGNYVAGTRLTIYGTQ